HFQKHLKDKFIHFANAGFQKEKEKGVNLYFEKPETLRAPIKVILGHKVNYKTRLLIPNNDIKEVVIFRNPIDWEISRFNQHANRLLKHHNKRLDFEYWLSSVNKTHSQFDWFLANYLLLGKSVNNISSAAKENILIYILSKFDYVFFVDDLDTQLKIIFKKLSIPETIKRENVVGGDKPQFFDGSRKNIDLLNTICKNDMNTFKTIKSIFSISNHLGSNKSL
ncbi:MAG: hypothetical protein KDC52_15820, partial [Ignavibacteriae bacterium]|nr:hypothetical protein [Ignavibacteriota bacterium]